MGGHTTDGAGLASGEAVLHALVEAYEKGWTPTDLVHVTQKAHGRAVAQLAIWAILYDAARTRATERAPLPWVRGLTQLSQLRGDTSQVSTDMQRAALARLWRNLPALPTASAPPSQWPTRRVDLGVPPAVEPLVLAHLQRLLAHAEATGFVEEAENFTADAQDLMTRYSLAQALRDDPDRTALRTRRVRLEEPYVKEKALLLSEVAEANGVRTVWHNELGLASIVGAEVDLAQTELLFASLLVQADWAIQQATESNRSFRKALLFGFAVRVGQRVREAGLRATAAVAREANLEPAELLPLIANRAEAVDEYYVRLFPVTRPTGASRLDTVGRGTHARSNRSPRPGSREATG